MYNSKPLQLTCQWLQTIVEAFLVLAQVDHKQPAERRVKHAAEAHLADRHVGAEKRKVLARVVVQDELDFVQFYQFAYAIETDRQVI